MSGNAHVLDQRRADQVLTDRRDRTHRCRWSRSGYGRIADAPVLLRAVHATLQFVGQGRRRGLQRRLRRPGTQRRSGGPSFGLGLGDGPGDLRIGLRVEPFGDLVAVVLGLRQILVHG